MAWSPVYIGGGLFGGTPESNLTVPVDNARQIGNCGVQGDQLYAYYDCSREFDPVYLSWSGSGKNLSEKMMSILNNHKGDGTHTDVEFLTVDVKNPQGAPYYKQQLVVYGSYFADPDTTEYSTSDLLKYFYAEVGVTKIARRVYSTPTAQPVTTDITVLPCGINFNKFVLGDMNIEPLYYFMETQGAKFVCGKAHYNNKYYFCFGFSYETWREYESEKKDNKYGFTCIGLDIDVLDEVFGGDFEPEVTDDPNEEPDEPGGGESGEGGGEGGHSGDEDDIPDPGLPPIGAADAGFVHMFKLTLTDIVAFAQTMFNSTIWQAIKDWFSDPMDFISGVMLLPFEPAGDTAKYPKFGSNIWPQAFTLVSNQFYRLDCGYLNCRKYYDSFLDFDSYSKVKIYLPYIGYRDLIADEVMGRDLHVYYNVDVATGDCVAFIEVNDGQHVQITYQFQGNCGMRVPYGRQSFDAAVTASMSMLGGVAGTALAVGGAAVASGGVLAPAAAGIAAAQIAGQIGSMTASAVSGQKRTMERAGSIGGSAGYMSVQYPYLIRQIPNQSRPGNYKMLHGYPSNIGGTLGSFSGFTSLESILLDGVSATETEKREIMEVCKGGVII